MVVDHYVAGGCKKAPESACGRHIFWYLRQCGRGRRDGLISRLIKDEVYIYIYISTRGRLPLTERDKRSSLQLFSLEPPLASSISLPASILSSSPYPRISLDTHHNEDLHSDIRYYLDDTFNLRFPNSNSRRTTTTRSPTSRCTDQRIPRQKTSRRGFCYCSFRGCSCV